jgi:hypothetical protein
MERLKIITRFFWKSCWNVPVYRNALRFKWGCGWKFMTGVMGLWLETGGELL